MRSNVNHEPQQCHLAIFEADIDFIHSNARSMQPASLRWDSLDKTLCLSWEFLLLAKYMILKYIRVVKRKNAPIMR